MSKIANTIRDQIMTLDFWALGSWGAHEYGAIPPREGQHLGGLAFSTNKCKFHPGNVKGKVYITLNALDLYDIEIGYVRRGDFECFSVKKHTDIYCDQLVDVISGDLE